MSNTYELGDLYFLTDKIKEIITLKKHFLEINLFSRTTFTARPVLEISNRNRTVKCRIKSSVSDPKYW